jgi:hypothetical protein
MNSQSEQNRIAFGYNRGPANQIELHPGQAAAVALIFKAYADGDSITQIASMLEAAEIPSPQNKAKWGKQTISNILSNAHYTGIVPYIPIIEQELYDKVQAIKEKRTPSLGR